MTWQSADFNHISLALGALRNRGERIYSAAYIMPAPAFGHERKHDNHLALLVRMIEDGLPARLSKARSRPAIEKGSRRQPIG